MAFLIPMVLATDVLVVLEAVQDSSVPWSSHDSGDTEWSPFTSFLFAIFCSLTTVDCPTQGDWDCLREKWATSSHWINQLFHPSYHFAIIEEKGRWKWEKKKKEAHAKTYAAHFWSPFLSLLLLSVLVCATFVADFFSTPSPVVIMRDLGGHYQQEPWSFLSF